MDEPAVSFNLAAFDALTGLPNRALFDDRLSQVIALSNRSGRRFAIHMFDLDGFKSVAQSAGSAGADEALKMIADRFVAALRESDTVARFGWDEFVALQPELEDEEDARDMAGTLQRALYALFPINGETAPSLLAAAERALRRAKAQGRGGVVFAPSNAASSA
jgi:diguanylate cyclase (GGDEF)-like protein